MTGGIDECSDRQSSYLFIYLLSCPGKLHWNEPTLHKYSRSDRHADASMNVCYFFPSLHYTQPGRYEVCSSCIYAYAVVKGTMPQKRNHHVSCYNKQWLEPQMMIMIGVNA
ncbi:uncharacterized protein FA14DRAFT_68646 [Meira miltonrushii]|uniref:Uncharacterized protein n=1 Tax=Meira miltonrushii TaxID=1280837 RepID=A0A316VDN7_9BASI|nr:uncharacterized protein FA14DRAFT_68646 [Meira miltonrushii]PWN34111.1 hypothetical protein FA14DRAFT_68646 [Meira miltonrushii]